MSGYVKSGAGMDVIVHSMKEEIGKLNGEDVVVVWGGANDIGKKNSQEALRHLCKFVDKSQNVNVIVMSAPHRHDLISSSCVNHEVVRFNRQLKKRMKLCKNLKILETDLNRDCFTKHGLHMNSSSKAHIIQNLAEMIESLSVKNNVSYIQLQWKENEINLDNGSTERILGIEGGTSFTVNQVSKNDEGGLGKPQLNKRQRKNPALKDQDFLWQI